MAPALIIPRKTPDHHRCLKTSQAHATPATMLASQRPQFRTTVCLAPLNHPLLTRIEAATRGVTTEDQEMSGKRPATFGRSSGAQPKRLLVNYWRQPATRRRPRLVA
jgi:hypothetical protein